MYRTLQMVGRGTKEIEGGKKELKPEARKGRSMERRKKKRTNKIHDGSQERKKRTERKRERKKGRQRAESEGQGVGGVGAGVYRLYDGLRECKPGPVSKGA